MKSCGSNPHLQKRLEGSTQKHLALSTCENGYRLPAMDHTFPEVLATVPLLWQSTVSHSLHCGYRILPGARVSTPWGALAVPDP